MTAEKLRAAAASIRERAETFREEAEFMLAVAAMLENAAEDLELQEPGGGLAKRWDMRIHIAGDRALAVADAYLADDARRDAR